MLALSESQHHHRWVRDTTTQQPCAAGIVVLDLSRSRAVDADVAAAVTQLPCLQALLADQCHKLTAELPEAMHSRAGGARMRILSVQRCYQLTSASLWQLLQLARHTQMHALAVSHVECFDMQELASGRLLPGTSAADAAAGSSVTASPHVALEDGAEQNGPAAATVERAPSRSSSTMSADTVLHFSAPAGSQLRVLALSSCTRLSLDALAVILAATPALRTLLLGGADLHAPDNVEPSVGGQPFASVLSAVEAEHALVRDSVKSGIAERKGAAVGGGVQKRTRCGAVPDRHAFVRGFCTVCVERGGLQRNHITEGCS